MRFTQGVSRFWLCAALAFLAGIASTRSAQAGMIMFEDGWPYNGDLDFNDQAIAYSFIEQTDAKGNVTNIRATFNVLAVGSTLHNGLYRRALRQ
jgi:hypothetical protein